MEISWSGIKDKIHKKNIFVDVVFGRSACVGQDVLKARGENIRFINLQKGRLDLFFNWLAGQPAPKANIIKPYVLAPGVFGLVKQQESIEWLKYRQPKYLLMDLYSELTDQKFTHIKEGWSFACHYSDLDHSGDFDQIFSSQGLMAVEDFKAVYAKFFAWFLQNYPNTKIVIVHYSARYDERQEFKDRVSGQRQVLRESASSNKNIINLELSDDDFAVFPYHYSDKTIAKNIDLWFKLESLTKDRDVL